MAGFNANLKTVGLFQNDEQKANFLWQTPFFMDGTSYQTIQSRGGPLCKMGQPNEHEHEHIALGFRQHTLEAQKLPEMLNAYDKVR